MLEITDDLYKLEQIYDICLSLDQALHWVGKLICEIGWYPDILTCDYVTVVSKEDNKCHTAAKRWKPPNHILRESVERIDLSWI